MRHIEVCRTPTRHVDDHVDYVRARNESARDRLLGRRRNPKRHHEFTRDIVRLKVKLDRWAIKCGSEKFENAWGRVHVSVLVRRTAARQNFGMFRR